MTAFYSSLQDRSKAEDLYGKDLEDYFNFYSERLAGLEAFCRVEKPLVVYKKTLWKPVPGPIGYLYTITSLNLPAGALVYAPFRVFQNFTSYPDGRKMRASVAEVLSNIDIAHGKEYKSAFSVGIGNPGLRYVKEESVYPHPKFSYRSETCAPGIHFFLNLGDALRYTF